MELTLATDDAGVALPSSLEGGADTPIRSCVVADHPLIAVTIIPSKSDATAEAAEVFHQPAQLVTWVYAQRKPGMLRNNTY